MGLWSAVANVASGVFGGGASIFNNERNIRAQEKINEANLALQREMNQQNQANWEKQFAYNDTAIINRQKVIRISKGNKRRSLTVYVTVVKI